MKKRRVQVLVEVQTTDDYVIERRFREVIQSAVNEPFVLEWLGDDSDRPVAKCMSKVLPTLIRERKRKKPRR